MKRLRTVNGVRYIQYVNRQDFEDKVQEAVTQHRATLITRLLAGLNEYLEYRFQKRVGKTDQEVIRENLMTLKHQAVPMENCEPVIEGLLKKDVYILGSSTYYNEIDERIRHTFDGR